MGAMILGVFSDIGRVATAIWVVVTLVILALWLLDRAIRRRRPVIRVLSCGWTDIAVHDALDRMMEDAGLVPIDLPDEDSNVQILAYRPLQPMTEDQVVDAVLHAYDECGLTVCEVRFGL